MEFIHFLLSYELLKVVCFICIYIQMLSNLINNKNHVITNNVS